MEKATGCLLYFYMIRIEGKLSKIWSRFDASGFQKHHWTAERTEQQICYLRSLLQILSSQGKVWIDIIIKAIRKFWWSTNFPRGPAIPYLALIFKCDSRPIHLINCGAVLDRVLVVTSWKLWLIGQTDVFINQRN